MAQVVLERSEQDRIEQLVARFDPATHAGFAQLAGEGLEVARAYTRSSSERS